MKKEIEAETWYARQSLVTSSKLVTTNKNNSMYVVVLAGGSEACISMLLLTLVLFPHGWILERLYALNLWNMRRS